MGGCASAARLRTCPGRVPQSAHMQTALAVAPCGAWHQPPHAGAATQTAHLICQADCAQKAACDGSSGQSHYRVERRAARQPHLHGLLGWAGAAVNTGSAHSAFIGGMLASWGWQALNLEHAERVGLTGSSTPLAGAGQQAPAHASCQSWQAHHGWPRPALAPQPGAARSSQAPAAALPTAPERRPAVWRRG